MTEAKEKLRAVVELLEYIDEKLPGMCKVALSEEDPTVKKRHMCYRVAEATQETVNKLIMPRVKTCGDIGLYITSDFDGSFNIYFIDFPTKTDQLGDAILNFLRAHDAQLDKDLKDLLKRWQKGDDS